MHVVCCVARTKAALGFVVVLFIPLMWCDRGAERTKGWAMSLVRDQAIEFSHHMGSLELADLLMHFSPLVRYMVAPAPRGQGEVHLIIHLISEA